ncbi:MULTISPECIES: glycosyltransferase [unclassified Streptomyces]|uniref:glycosyltransferase n=1 Tax=unclassified Streptomyces TaxID=2593676 RepID=UPI00088E9485|nr:MULTISPECIES: glycosyltransferase [unclassified Streptomyces]PBC86861.1 glycosyltransferase involved in cell wall bisynthesis [Streptomyces sp. 2321.6]SDQ69955.1 Glycosyltransferase involved in cell wall bisynthesis [Streptomyces sp. KS_16]SEE11726.1 Glycosyltransferase involved in cell wall bisynthesis [Streptomyces sp. 2133.1]SNC74037.1 Glycosyltransferase involved in cell wall bisynthesis [Streptomyces sp. 2114.4]
MRVTHVVTLVSDDGAYGGPVSVATGQLGELASRGHAVELVSLWRGRGALPRSVDGVPLRARPARTLVPGQGFLGLFHPGLLPLLWRSAGRAEALHLHAGRDLVSLAALAVAVVRRRPFVVQTHGMVQPRRSAVARLFDRVYVPLLRRAAAALVLTDEEEAGLRQVLGPRGPRLVRLPNGVRTRPDDTNRSAADVLFLARLQSRKRPEAFVRMAALVHRKRPEVSFTLHGSDEGRLAEVRRLIAEEGLGEVVTYGGALDHDAAVQRTARATVYVLPSVDEPFPMSVLESLAVGTPVVCTDSCGIAPALERREAAVVTDGSPEALADAVLHLLEDRPLRERVTRAGREAVEEEFSLAAVADRLTELYGSLARPGTG